MSVVALKVTVYVYVHVVCCCVVQVILTYGMSDTTLLFLKEASRKREFQVGQGDVEIREQGLGAVVQQAVVVAVAATTAGLERAGKATV